MALNIAEAKTWSDEQLLIEFERLRVLQKQLVGWLYSSINADEMSVLIDIARERHPTPIVDWRETGVVPTTWTDLFYVVHEWRSTCWKDAKPAPLPDKPAKTVTCLLCTVELI